ncbi:MAG: hypothetical protein JXB26_04070 [Candidatus Aminicenantes bacterium]|nr:hypothetical protein [Candidatus Aminicenantes bacterium]
MKSTSKRIAKQKKKRQWKKPILTKLNIKETLGSPGSGGDYSGRAS